jgi:hypothetical protein
MRRCRRTSIALGVPLGSEAAHGWCAEDGASSSDGRHQAFGLEEGDGVADGLDVDPELGCQVVPGRTSTVIERATTKSGRSRLVPLSDLVIPVVRDWMEGREPDDLLSRLRRAVTSAPRTGVVRCAGRRPDWEGVRTICATAASLWIAAGVDIKTVSSWLGHSTPKLTGHLRPPHGYRRRRAFLERVNRALGSGSGTHTARGEEDSTRGTAKWPLTCGNVVVPPARFELATPALGERCSIP